MTALPLTFTQDGTRMVLAGRIDENADLARLADELSPHVTTLDLGGLVRINSIGVREWMDFITGLGTRVLELERCAPIFVEQLNAIANFAGSARIASVLSQYECEHDGELVTLEVRTSDARNGQLPATPACPRCARPMLPAFEPDLYYRFLRYAK